MSALDFLERNLLWIAPPLMVAGVLLLALCIRNEVRVVKGSKLLSAPLVEQQKVEFPEAGRASLCIEGPQFSRRFARLSYALWAEDGTPVEGRAVLFRTRTSGFSWVRLELRTYEIPHPGRYLLRVEGLGAPQPGDVDHHVVFTRPHTAQTVGYILGMIFSFALFLVSFIFFMLHLLGKG
jgi:hypothetical protein